MIERQARSLLEAQLALFPAVALLGPRQVGKTTLARGLGTAHHVLYLDAEDPRDLAKLEAPAAYLDGYRDRLVVVDEVQRLPGLFGVLRGLIDARRRQGRRAGHFLLLGSASHALLRQSSETLAGRLATVELGGFLLEEISTEAGGAPDRLWLRGGFPESFLATSERASLAWRRAFVTTYLERDIPAMGPRVPATTLRRLWTMLAHQSSSTLNQAQLAGSLGLSGQTVGRYIDLLTDLLLVRRLQPWARNTGKRMVRSPRVYLRDSGIAHALLGIGSLEALLAHPSCGGSWEGLVIEQLIAAGDKGLVAPWFYRTASGAEVDLVLEHGGGRLLAIEIKRSAEARPSRGFFAACEDLQPAERWLVHGGQESFPGRHGVMCLTVADATCRLRTLVA